MNKYLKTILKKMCKEIGADYDKINFKKAGWFTKHEWTEKQENKFKEWLINYITKNKEARRVLMACPNLSNKKQLEKFSNEFIFNFGWKCKRT